MPENRPDNGWISSPDGGRSTSQRVLYETSFLSSRIEFIRHLTEFAGQVVQFRNRWNWTKLGVPRLLPFLGAYPWARHHARTRSRATACCAHPSPIGIGPATSPVCPPRRGRRYGAGSLLLS